MNTEKPGNRLAKELQARDWSQQVLADVLGRPAQLVSEIIHGKKEITRETAAQLGAALGTTPELWLRLQDDYLLAQMAQDDALQRKLAEIARRAESVVIKPPPAPPVYRVQWSERERRYVATVDAYPGLRATSKGEKYAVRKLKAMVAAARREQKGPPDAGRALVPDA